MLGGLLLLVAAPGVLGTASAQNPQLCEGYAGPDGRYRPGFYCPRLTDPASHRYCCRPDPLRMKSCCSRREVQELTGLNGSGRHGPGVSPPLLQPLVSLFALFVLLLVSLDLAHFCRSRRCSLRRRPARDRGTACTAPAPPHRDRELPAGGRRVP